MKKSIALLAVLSCAASIFVSCQEQEVKQYDGYKLVWQDEFTGSKLDETKWNKEVREPGWTNHEMQAYTKDKENIYIKDGKLVLSAVKHPLKSGNAYYTSGKVQTRNKYDFTYGKVVARAKVPVGKGLWPAIWMMPTKELYGNWPVCGEIDIMEVLGNEPNKTYGTIHYGSPHGQKQGTYVLKNGTFGDDFHEFSVEWEPGEMRYYVDDNLFFSTSDWFAKSRGGENFDYPAPFNQDFYIQMNLAVGGDWPGKPDKNTDFEKSKFEIDYVRVYKKDFYDENVTRPEKPWPKPQDNGNYVYNENFAENESLGDTTHWQFLKAAGGEGKAEIKNNQLIITTENDGRVDYSIQLVHWNIPARAGKKYRITFEAKADENRKGIVCISAPEVNWIRYFPNTEFKLTPEWKKYTYEYKMNYDDDPLARLEYNMGATGSKATFYLKNVSVVELD